MQPTTRSAVTVFATLYTLAFLTGSPSALGPWQKIFQKKIILRVDPRRLRSTYK
jgi:hypothetical protein